MLTNLLPGLREIRAPLAAGYLWFLCAWLILDGPTRSELSPGPIKELADLAADAPPGAVLAALSFAAYLLGSLSEDLFSRLAMSHRAGVMLGRVALAMRPVSHRMDRSPPGGLEFLPVSSSTGERPTPTGTRDGADDDSAHRSTASLEREAVQHEIQRLGNSIERLESENALRLALLPPLTTLTLYLAIEQNVLWGLGLLLLPAFVAQVVDRQARIDREALARAELIETAKLAALALARLPSPLEAQAHMDFQVEKIREKVEAVREEVESARESVESPLTPVDVVPKPPTAE